MNLIEFGITKLFSFVQPSKQWSENPDAAFGDSKDSINLFIMISLPFLILKFSDIEQSLWRWSIQKIVEFSRFEISWFMIGFSSKRIILRRDFIDETKLDEWKMEILSIILKNVQDIVISLKALSFSFYDKNYLHSKLKYSFWVLWVISLLEWNVRKNCK
jgi:hypothetical protein